MRKKFKLTADQLRPLVEGLGACFATDRITVDGERVGFMYRQVPDRDIDSGWRFMAGTESTVYMDNADNMGVYDVNTIANFDPDIIPLLNAPVGAAYERRGGTGEFEAVDFEPES